VLGNYKGFWRAQIREGRGQHVGPLKRAAGYALAPLIEGVAQHLAPGSEGFNLPQAERFTRALDIPVICVGGFHSRAAIAGALRAGSCDAVSAARAFIADPYLYANTVGEPMADRPVCGYCNGCIARFGGQPIDCYRPAIKARKTAMLDHEPPSRARV
jgi:2,4-dienoyl-CoA reductase-like NADH-dependent reductase (Old Yellow Enzyme family)